MCNKNLSKRLANTARRQRYTMQYAAKQNKIRNVIDLEASKRDIIHPDKTLLQRVHVDISSFCAP